MSIEVKSSDEEPERQRSTASVAPENVFDRVQGDGTICNRCFRRMFERVTMLVPGHVEDSTPVEAIVSETDTGNLVLDTRERVEEVETCHPQRVEAPQSTDIEVPQSWQRSTPPPKTVCECGAIDQDGTRATLSLDEARRHAQRIANRLDEESIAIDRVTLIERIGTWKTDERLQGRDDEVMAAAVHAAVAVGRDGTMPSEESVLREHFDDHLVEASLRE